MKITVSIPSTKESGGLRPFTLYNVEVRTDDAKTNSYNKWIISIRYNDFHELYEKLQAKHASLKGYDFPPKQAFGRFDQEVIETRRKGLEKFVQYCLTLQEILFDERFMAFLKITHLRGQLQLSQLQNPDDIPERPKANSFVAAPAPQPSAASTTGAPVLTVPPIDSTSSSDSKRATVRAPPPAEAGVDMRAMYPYADGDVKFEVGDIIRVVEKQGSWWGAYVKGVYCQVPANYLESPDAPSDQSSSATSGAEEGAEYTEGLEAVAMFDYAPANARASSQMITFNIGDIIDLYSPDQEGDWWFGSVRGTSDWGYFPRNYVRVLSATDYVLGEDGKWDYRDDLTNYVYDNNKKAYVPPNSGNTLPKRPLPVAKATAATIAVDPTSKRDAHQSQRQSVLVKVAQRPQSIMISRPANNAPTPPAN